MGHLLFHLSIMGSAHVRVRATARACSSLTHCSLTIAVSPLQSVPQGVYGEFLLQLEAGDVVGDRSVMVPDLTKHACSILCGSTVTAIVIDRAHFRAAMDRLAGEVCESLQHSDCHYETPSSRKILSEFRTVLSRVQSGPDFC